MLRVSFKRPSLTFNRTIFEMWIGGPGTLPVSDFRQTSRLVDALAVAAAPEYVAAKTISESHRRNDSLSLNCLNPYSPFGSNK